MIFYAMTVYKQFLKVNRIKQVELAQFLGVTESSVSSAVNGRNNLSEENLTKILENDRGWDVSMFRRAAMGRDAIGENLGVIINQGGNHGSIDNRHYYSDSPDVLRAQIDVLEERIKEKDAQIKEKDAQIKQLLDILQGKN